MCSLFNYIYPYLKYGNMTEVADRVTASQHVGYLFDKYNGMFFMHINKYMRFYNGNKKKQSITILSQNIPVCYRTSEVVNKLHEIVFRYHPTVLCLNEVRNSVINTIDLPDYVLIGR